MEPILVRIEPARTNDYVMPIREIFPPINFQMCQVSMALVCRPAETDVIYNFL
jgi:hypothetical protein